MKQSYNNEHLETSQEDDGMSEWLLPFCDMLIFILAFFAILYTLSQSDLTKSQQIIENIQESLGNKTANAIQEKETQKEDQIEEQLYAFLKEKNLINQFKIVKTHRGLEISTNSELLFISGSATLGYEAKHYLNKITPFLVVIPHYIFIEGHTDSIPVYSKQFASNWELSSARASSVVRYLISEGVTSTRLSAVGYADTRPVSNQSADAENRRVVILIDQTGLNSA